MTFLSEYASGSTEPWTVSVLQALIRLRRPKRLLELGTFEGRTTIAMSAVMPRDATLCTVDIEDHWIDLQIDARTQRYTQDALDFLDSSCDGDHDFVFVDDDHTFAHVKEEVDLLMGGIVSSGGLIVLHDVIGPFGLDEIVRERGGFIIDLPLLHAAGGLGIIEVP